MADIPDKDSENQTAKRKSFVLRIDHTKLKAIEKWATDEFRSVNGQLEWIIQKALSESKRWPPGDNL